MKQVHYYDDKFLYTVSEPAYLNVPETEKQGKEVYYCPEMATLAELPEVGEHQVQQFDGTAWRVVTDYRHEQQADKDLNLSEITYLGEVKEGYIYVPKDKVDKIREDKLYYVIQDGELVENPNYEAEKAPEYKKELINDIYEIKANKAYGGVIINDMLVFETNQTSITNTVASLALMSDTATANWKFYTVSGEPYVQQVSKLQLAGIAQFGQNMINETFAVEGQANTQLSTATVEQLNSEDWRNNFLAEVQAEMDKVNNKLQVTFS